MEFYRRSKPAQLPPPKEITSEVPDDNLLQDPEVEIIGVFPAKPSIKMMIQDSF